MRLVLIVAGVWVAASIVVGLAVAQFMGAFRDE